MEVKEVLLAKYFSVVSYIVAFLLHVVLLPIIVGFTGHQRTSERRSFHCDVPACRHDCFKKYDEQYNSPFPLYGFAVLCFVPSLVVCLVYSWVFVKRRVDEIEGAMEPNPKNPHQRPGPSEEGTRRVFCYFVLHLLVRFVLRISFAGLQNSVFYAANTSYQSVFPTKFACYVCGSNFTNLNLTNNCYNSVGMENATWAFIIWLVNISSALLLFGEMCYVLVRALKSDTFIYDVSFCQKYFFGKRTITIGMHHFLNSYKSLVQSETIPLKPLSASGGENNDKHDIFVDLKICIGRAEDEFDYSLERHKMYDIYLRPKQGSVPIENLRELFKNKDPTKDPRTILIVGRPGTGKSLLCRKMWRDWARNELSEFADSTKTYFFLFEFSSFNSETEEEEKISLKKLLSRKCPGDQIDNEVFQYILDKPERVILVFDGLNEFKHLQNCLRGEPAQGGGEEIYFSALYVKLLKGIQLKGATIVTTCRPNVVHRFESMKFDRTVEIMGFTPEKVQEYVCKFCAKNTQAMDRIWMHLSSNSELLSLCYIPAYSYIICTVLENVYSKAATTEVCCCTTTEVYSEALSSIIVIHCPELETKRVAMGDAAFLIEMEQKDFSSLLTLAKVGVEEERLLFGSREVEKLKKYRFLNPKPKREAEANCFEQKYYFSHVIIQELFAAKEIIKTSESSSEISHFILSNASDPKWQFVIQFVAGLLRGQENEVVNSFVSQLNKVLTAVSVEKRENKQMALLMLKCLYEYNDKTIVEKAASKLHCNSKFNKEIDLSDCQVTSIECTAIAYFVKHLVELTLMDLSGSNITIQSVLHLCGILRNKNYKNTRLNLRSNRITDEDFFNLCNTLEQESFQLAHCSHSYTIITDKGRFYLRRMLQTKNCKLTLLDLRENSITDQGLSSLRGTLVQGPRSKVKSGRADN